MAIPRHPGGPIDLDPTLDFLRLLWSIEHGLQRASKRMESSRGVTGPQRLVLRIVREHPGITARALGDLIHLHPSTITGILQRLEQKGLLIRERDAVDNRRIRLKVHARAKVHTDKSAGTIEATVAAALASVPARQLGYARDVLAAVALALDGGILG